MKIYTVTLNNVIQLKLGDLYYYFLLLPQPQL